MKKTAYLCAALLLCASSAFAYTNQYAGYSLNNKTPEFIMESSKIYGYKNADKNSLHAVSYFKAEDMEKVIEKPFTTAYFDECYNKLAVLDKNELDKGMLKLPMLDLKNYSKINYEKDSVLEDAMKKLDEEIKPEIRLDKIGGKKAITLSISQKRANELVTTDLSFISANNVMYLLATGCNDTYAELKEPEDTKDKKETKDTKSIVEDKKKETPKFEPVKRNKLDPVLATKIWQDHVQFVKLFKTAAPVKTAKQEIAYNDAIGGRKVVLPEAWAYAQYNFNDKNKPAVLSLALPADTMVKFTEKITDHVNKSEKPLTKDNGEVVGNAFLASLDQLFASCSVKINNDKDLAKLLSNPMVAKLEADILIKQGLERAKAFGAPYFKLNDYKYKTDFDVNKGKLDLMLDVTLFNEFDFVNFFKMAGTSEKGSCVLQLTKKGLDANPELKKIYDKWSF
ncbi:MAG: hypothetical protein MJ050_05545 [Phascolarctobacterium sp.]|nr:hypothetical protein [Phascolarctobacterium sp.]